MFKDTSKIMTWYIWKVTYQHRKVTIVRGISYHLLGSWISWDLKIWFWLQVESYISNWRFSKLQHSASYVSCHNAMAYDTSKRSFVPAMIYRHNIGVNWGPYTPSTAPKIIPFCSGGCPSSIWCIGMERKASCGTLGGHFCWRRPWLAMVVLVDVGCWRLTSDQPTVGIVTIVYGNNFFYS